MKNQDKVCPIVDLEKCKGSGFCVQACPHGVLRLENGKVVIADSSKCDYCTSCEIVCPNNAIKCPFKIVSG